LGGGGARGVPAVGVGVGDGVGAGCEGTGEGLDTGLVAGPLGVGAGAAWWATAGGVDAVVGEAAGAAGWPAGVAACWMSKAASGSTETVMAFGETAGEPTGDAAVVAGVSGMTIGLSWPTRPADDAVPSRPVLAAIAPTAAVSVRPMAPAAAIADLLGIMATSFVFASGSSVGFQGVEEQ